MKFLPLPQKFDENEWFLLCISVASYLLIMLLPRRFPRVISFMIFLFGLSCARWADHVIGTEGALDLYDIHDSKLMELADIFTYPVYGAWCYIFIYCYDKLRVRGWVQHTGYLIMFTVLGTAIEYVSHLFNMFTYENWNVFYSFLFYLGVQPLTIGYYYLIKRMYNRLPRASNKKKRAIRASIRSN